MPETERRLGDMRLECRVRLAIGKYEGPFWIIALVNTVLMTSDWCASDKLDWHGKTQRQLTGATLIDGERKLELKLQNGREFMAPIGDKSWPDDARIELRFVEAL